MTRAGLRVAIFAAAVALGTLSAIAFEQTTNKDFRAIGQEP